MGDEGHHGEARQRDGGDGRQGGGVGPGRDEVDRCHGEQRQGQDVDPAPPPAGQVPPGQ